MYTIDFEKPMHVHFIGIGGISMSGLAEILKSRGFTVTGSDVRESDAVKILRAQGIEVCIGQRASNIKDDIDLVVYTAAIHEDNPEWKAAAASEVPMLTRAEFLGQLMDNYSKSVAVSGTHGKTTTTSMIAHILLEAGADPTISVGGMLPSIGGNVRAGNSDVFLTEACEYMNSFLEFRPKYGIILNIEEDHLDFFKDIDDIRSSFKRFAENVLPGGAVIINSGVENAEYITESANARTVSCGIKGDEDYTASDIKYDNRGCPSFDLVRLGEVAGRLTLRVPGEHNIGNALAAAAFAAEAGISFESISKGLNSFAGTERRFEIKGNLKGITIVDDYAHHPTEIRATLAAARNYPHGRIICAFQSHTYTRTRAFWHEFASALSAADIVVLSDVYPARETDTLGIDMKDMAREIQELGTRCYYFPSFDEIENFLLEECVNNDLLITMGAGDMYQVGERLLGIR